MTSAPPTGVLVITCWAENTAGEFRVNVVSTTDIIVGTEDRFVSTEPEEILQYVRRWLGDFRRRVRDGDATTDWQRDQQGLTEAGSIQEREGE